MSGVFLYVSVKLFKKMASEEPTRAEAKEAEAEAEAGGQDQPKVRKKFLGLFSS